MKNFARACCNCPRVRRMATFAATTRSSEKNGALEMTWGRESLHRNGNNVRFPCPGMAWRSRLGLLSDAPTRLEKERKSCNRKTRDRPAIALFLIYDDIGASKVIEKFFSIRFCVPYSTVGLSKVRLIRRTVENRYSHVYLPSRFQPRNVVDLQKFITNMDQLQKYKCTRLSREYTPKIILSGTVLIEVRNIARKEMHRSR